jgi:hypothetical protein
MGAEVSMAVVGSTAADFTRWVGFTAADLAGSTAIDFAMVGSTTVDFTITGFSLGDPSDILGGATIRTMDTITANPITGRLGIIVLIRRAITLM